MARPTRFEITGIPQHVVQRGNNRGCCFFNDGDRALYLDCLADAARRLHCDVHAYVLMGNHVHLLITPRERHAVSRLMQAVGRRYVRHVNDRQERTGTLWEGRFRSSLVDSGRYLFACYRYIELNPVRAGLVRNPCDYRWSSYRRNALGATDPLITEHAQYASLGERDAQRRDAYRRLFDDALDPAVVEEIRRSVNTCAAFASDAFQDGVERMLRRRVGPAKRGRPRKPL